MNNNKMIQKIHQNQQNIFRLCACACACASVLYISTTKCRVIVVLIVIVDLAICFFFYFRYFPENFHSIVENNQEQSSLWIGVKKNSRITEFLLLLMLNWKKIPLNRIKKNNLTEKEIIWIDFSIVVIHIIQAKHESYYYWKKLYLQFIRHCYMMKPYYQGLKILIMYAYV